MRASVARVPAGCDSWDEFWDDCQRQRDIDEMRAQEADDRCSDPSDE